MAVTSGSYTVGSAKDYSTWAAAIADTSTLTGNLTFTQETNTTETGGSSINKALGGFILKLTSDSKPNGNPATGYTTTLNHTSFQFHSTHSNGTLDFDGIYTVGNGTDTSLHYYLQTSQPVIMQNCMLDGKQQSSGQRAVLTNSGSLVFKILNCVWWDFVGTAFPTFYTVACHADSKTENCISYNCHDPFQFNNKAQTVKNLVCLDPSAGTCYTSTLNVTGDNVYATDTSAFGTAAVNSITAANEVESLDDTNAEFLKPKLSGQLDDGGTGTGLMSENTAGINLVLRPSGGFTSAGAWQIGFAANNGTLGGTLPLITSQLTGDVKLVIDAILGANIPLITSQLVGALTNEIVGTLGATTPLVTSQLSAADMEDPILTQIEFQMQTILEGLTTAGGYYYDWATVNEQDLAKVSKGSGYPAALIEIEPDEENIDDPDGADAQTYQNRVTFKVTAFNKIAKAVNPVKQYRLAQNRMLHDLKKAFGTNYQLNGVALVIMYRRSSRINYANGDIQLPGALETFWDVNYSQDRLTPNQIGF